MQLFLIRHGESTANADGRLQGHLDFSLSERGRRESERLAERLAGLPVEALYTSPLKRARETAEIVAERLALGLVERAALMERDVGGLAGLNREEIRARYPDLVQARAEGRLHEVIGGWESDADFNRRVEACLDEIIAGHAERTVVVTHGGVISAFCRRALSLPSVRPGPFAVSNAGITIFDVRDGDVDQRVRQRIQLTTLNDVCHLDGL